MLFRWAQSAAFYSFMQMQNAEIIDIAFFTFSVFFYFIFTNLWLCSYKQPTNYLFFILIFKPNKSICFSLFLCQWLLIQIYFKYTIAVWFPLFILFSFPVVGNPSKLNFNVFYKWSYFFPREIFFMFYKSNK